MIYLTALTLADNEAQFFEALKESRRGVDVITAALQHLYPEQNTAERIENCGRFTIKSEDVILAQSKQGKVYAQNVKWCKSRFCPICGTRIMGALQATRAQRAKAAAQLGLHIAFAQFGQPHGAHGDLAEALDQQRQDWKVFPSPSRAPAAFRYAGLAYKGQDWNTELDWCRDSRCWHVHAHSLAFSASEWTASRLALFRSLWPRGEPLTWAEPCEIPEAAARYSCKPQNESESVIGLFELARAEEYELTAEYLAATFGVTLRARSGLKLGGGEEKDAALLTAADAPKPGDTVVKVLSLRQWRAGWRPILS